MTTVQYDIPNWVRQHRATVWEWFQTVQDPSNPEQVNWCKNGSLFPIGANEGLGPTALALKLCHILNFFDLANNNLRDRMVERINSFQSTNESAQGYYEDPALLKAVEKRKWFRLVKNLPVRRAETRQAITALKSVGAKSLRPFTFIPQTTEEISAYFEALPWEADPWGAGSHASALLVFLHANKEWFAQAKNLATLEAAVFHELDKRFQSETGSWHLGTPLPHQIINSGMKVYTGYDYLGLPPPHPERLIDFCLSAAANQGACNHVDLIYVLYVASRRNGYRHEEIRKFAFQTVGAIKQYRQPDGGLSYDLNGAQTNYRGMAVSMGIKGISDLHGTKLFTWALSLISGILGWDNELGWRLPVV